MSTDQPSNGERLRATAEAIVRRIERDPAFAEQIRDDPMEALLAAGVPAAQINDELFRAIDGTDEVAGYGQCTKTCGAVGVTCGPHQATCGSRGTCATDTCHLSCGAVTCGGPQASVRR